MYEFIEEDLLKAIELLPETPQEARLPYETPHKGTAKALLAEVYLSMAGYPCNDVNKYQKAAQMAGDVIENAQTYNFALLNDFADLWKSKNKYHSEDIFSLHFNAEKDAKLNEFAGKFSYDTLKNLVELNTTYVPEVNFYNRMPHNYRKIKTMTTGYYGDDYIVLPDTSFHVNRFIPFDPIEDNYSYWQYLDILKWNDLEELEKLYTSNPDDFDSYWTTILNYRSYSSTNLYLLRFAQTLLTYAEAKARIGELDASALEALNKVRRRANKVNVDAPSEFDLLAGIAPEAFINAVIDERSFEFFMEPDGRWFDIIRLNMKDTIPLLIHETSTPLPLYQELFTEEWYFYKIPQEDLKIINGNNE